MKDIVKTNDGSLICRNCGSKNITVRPGMMVDRAICNNCGNEEYL
jgi:RNA polymerase subunit RPABC4/transcription elongation factor Spt4